MATCTKIVILCYLLLYPHYSFAFDHVTIVNEDTIDKEFDNNIYQKNLFQPTSYLNAYHPVIRYISLKNGTPTCKKNQFMALNLKDVQSKNCGNSINFIWSSVQCYWIQTCNLLVGTSIETVNITLPMIKLYAKGSTLKIKKVKLSFKIQFLGVIQLNMKTCCTWR